MATTIIAKNQTAGDLALAQLSSTDAKIPASGQITLTDFNTVAEIRNDSELYNYIDGDSLILNVDAVDLTKQQSLSYVTAFAIKHNSTSSDPTTTDDEDSGYSKGSLWVNTSTDKGFICTDATSTSAVWQPFTDVAVDSPFDIKINPETMGTSGNNPQHVLAYGIHPALRFSQNATAYGAWTTAWTRTPPSDVTLTIWFSLEATGSGTTVRIAAKTIAKNSSENIDAAFDEEQVDDVTVTPESTGDVYTTQFTLSKTLFADGDLVTLHIGRDGNEEVSPATPVDNFNKSILITRILLQVP